MKSLALCSIAVLIVAGACATVRLSAAAQPAPPTTQRSSPVLRVGVYDSRAVCVGSRNSGATNKQVDELRKQLKDAEAAGDAKRVEQIKARGQTLQTVRHLQAFSNAPVDEFLAQIKDKLPAIAAEAKVDVIVAKADYCASGVETIDVTDALVKAFNPDEKTLKTVAELRKQKPIEMVDVLGHKD
jgi:hypothetical protein